MANTTIEVPDLGESIEEAVIVQWLAREGDLVQKGDPILELESDKANVEVHSPETGILHVKSAVGGTVKTGHQVGEIENVQEATRAAPENPSVNQNIQQEKIPETKRPANLKTKRESLNEFQWTEQLSPFVKAMSKKLLKGHLESVPATTFNDIDMSKVNAIRERKKAEFIQKYGAKLGYMSFFCRAVIMALKEYPILNSQLNEKEIIFNKKVHLGIAVTRDKGLVVPVINNSDEMSYAELEKAIAEKANKASKGNLDLTELSGGTFTITNGGIFGSLFSTPLLNPPQVGILGMHRIDYRPVAIKDEKGNYKLEIRPMMYVALTYDHRLVEGKLAVQFLTRVKESLENVDETKIFAGGINVQ